jgi:hypothetical protein
MLFQRFPAISMVFDHRRWLLRRLFQKRYWAFAAGLLLAALGVIWFALRPDPLPGALGEVFVRLRVGMSQSEAVALIQDFGTANVDCYYYRGLTRDGRPFSGCCQFDGLPSAQVVAQGELEVYDDDGRELVIALGTGGIVSGIRLRSPHWREEFWHALPRWIAIG